MRLGKNTNLQSQRCFSILAYRAPQTLVIEAISFKDQINNLTRVKWMFLLTVLYLTKLALWAPFFKRNVLFHRWVFNFCKGNSFALIGKFLQKISQVFYLHVHLPRISFFFIPFFFLHTYFTFVIGEKTDISLPNEMFLTLWYKSSIHGVFSIL